jgi:tRNA(fMet)-specific endonuclease VapC
LTRQVPLLYPDGPETCRHDAQQAHALRRRGIPIGANDL